MRSQPWHWMEVSGKIRAPADLTPGREPSAPFG
jgi:hypothetical protein